MDLWIRSQDKEILMKANRIDVDNKNIIVWDNDCHCGETYMGEYKTKERALEVLDEIQNRITMLALFSLSNDELTDTFIETVKESSLIVYEMPKE